MIRTYRQTQRDLAHNIRDARLRAKMSQEQLALMADVDRSYVSQIERGIGNPSVRVLHRIAACLSVELFELFRPPTTIRARV
jgi:transcriptional regulator with XRE-family HTH domain